MPKAALSFVFNLLNIHRWVHQISTDQLIFTIYDFMPLPPNKIYNAALKLANNIYRAQTTTAGRRRGVPKPPQNPRRSHNAKAGCKVQDLMTMATMRYLTFYLNMDQSHPDLIWYSTIQEEIVCFAGPKKKCAPLGAVCPYHRLPGIQGIPACNGASAEETCLDHRKVKLAGH